MEDEVVIKMLCMRTIVFVDGKQVLYHRVKDPQVGTFKQFVLPGCLGERVMTILNTQAGHQGFKRTVGLIRLVKAAAFTSAQIKFPMDYLLASKLN